MKAALRIPSPSKTKGQSEETAPYARPKMLTDLSPTKAIPLMAAAPTTSKVLPCQLRPVVLAGIQFDDFYHVALLLHYNGFAFRKPEPQKGDRQKQ